MRELTAPPDAEARSLTKRSHAAQVASMPVSPEPIPPEAVCLDDFETIARGKLPDVVYSYISGGAADEVTLRANRDAYARIRLRPRVLVDVSQLDTRVQLFGDALPFPAL